jgi:hypothetical protein
MAPPKKYKEPPNLFSYRRDKETWSAFTTIAHVKGTSPTQIFDECVDGYIDNNRALIDTIESLKKKRELKEGV